MSPTRDELGDSAFEFTPAADPFGDRAAEEGILTVGELTARIRSRLEGLGRLAVEGEISGIRHAASGHLYFSLKDRVRGVESVLSCAIWRSRLANAVRFRLEEGSRVVAHGELDVYAPRGSYSLIVDRVEPRGVGTLLARLEEQKRVLRERGWFDRARPLPRFPRLVGVATSRDGAAFRDFLRTRSLRWPLYPVRLAHTPVQGPGAAERIAEAIARLDASGVDVIVVTRGGGSLEDLWAFNEMPVLEAIRAASVPVVSGVGHETDTTLADFVADHRAHTPTDAAQAVIPDRAAFLAALERAFAHLSSAVDRALLARKERLERLARRPVLTRPEALLERPRLRAVALGEGLVRAGCAALERRERRLEALARRLAERSPRARVERVAGRLPALALALARPLEARLMAAERRLEGAARALAAISPYAVLERGYSITRRAGGGPPLLDARDLAPGERLETLLARGSVESRVEAVRPEGTRPAGETDPQGRKERG